MEEREEEGERGRKREEEVSGKGGEWKRRRRVERE